MIQLLLASFNTIWNGVSEIELTLTMTLSLNENSYQSVSLLLFSAQNVPWIKLELVNGVKIACGDWTVKSTTASPACFFRTDFP